MKMQNSKKIYGSKMNDSKPNGKKAAREEQEQYFFALRQMVSREVKRKYSRSTLGILWSVLSPLLRMAVMSMVFSTIFRRQIENYPIYYFTGQLFYSLFSDATDHGMTALVDNRSMLLKVKLSKQTFVIARVLTALANFAYTCVAYAIMLLVFRVKPTLYMLLFPVDVFFMLLFAMGIAFGLSILYAFFADIKYLYSVALQLLMYVSALFYPVESLSETMRKVVNLNPVYNYINFARDIMLYGIMPEPVLWLKVIFWGVGSFTVGYGIFKRYENRIMEKL